MPTHNVPNLDGMPPSELFEFWNDHQGGRKAKELFPEGGKGTRIVTHLLASYASNKGTAMTCRARGNIQAALMYEQIADKIYQRLPKEIRW